MSSDHQCSVDVTDKQTDGCHDSSVDVGVGPMQPVLHVICSDVPSPDTDVEGTRLSPYALFLGLNEDIIYLNLF